MSHLFPFYKGVKDSTPRKCCSHLHRSLTQIPHVHNYTMGIINNGDWHDEACTDHRTTFLVRHGGSMARTVVDPHFSLFQCKWTSNSTFGYPHTGGEEGGGGEHDTAVDDHKPKMVVEGMIPFHLFLGTAVVMGEILCDSAMSDHRMTVLQLFYEQCKRHGWSLVIACVREELLDQLRKYEMSLQVPRNLVVVQFGEELIFDPANWESILRGRHNAEIRKKINRAHRAQLSFHEHHHHHRRQGERDDKLEDQMRHLRNKWLKSRAHIGQAYLCMARLFVEPIGKRWFYCADADGVMQGIVVVSRMDVHDGYLLEHLIVPTTAPVGTSEFLVWSVMREVYQSENCRYLSFAPDSSSSMMDEISGMYPWLARATQSTCKWMLRNRWFDVDSKLRFRSKFRPVRSVKSYVVVYHKRAVSPFDGIAILKAFNVLGGGKNHELKWIRREEQSRKRIIVGADVEENDECDLIPP